MDLEEIKNILDLIAESDVNEVTIEEGDFKIKVKKTADVVAGSSAPVQYQMPAAPQQPSPHPPGPAGQEALQQETAPEATEESGHVINSPIVGTFYRSPSPEDDPFVNEGDQVQKGETLCIVEAMKIMNEIESEVSGTIKKVLVEDGEAVEFEQPLFVIDK
jgi:acetyl-CoA carboxylase biotin carboxyl carrier protein